MPTSREPFAQPASAVATLGSATRGAMRFVDARAVRRPMLGELAVPLTALCLHFTSSPPFQNTHALLGCASCVAAGSASGSCEGTRCERAMTRSRSEEDEKRWPSA